MTTNGIIEHAGSSIPLGTGVLTLYDASEPGRVRKFTTDQTLARHIDDGLISFVVVTTVYRCQVCKGTGSRHRITAQGTAYVEQCVCVQQSVTLEDTLPTSELPGCDDALGYDEMEEERYLEMEEERYYAEMDKEDGDVEK